MVVFLTGASSKSLVKESVGSPGKQPSGTGEQNWQIFKDAFHRAQELLVPGCKKSGKEGKRPAWLSGDLLVRLKSKRELHRQGKQGRVSWEERRGER